MNYTFKENQLDYETYYTLRKSLTYIFALNKI